MQIVSQMIVVAQDAVREDAPIFARVIYMILTTATSILFCVAIWVDAAMANALLITCNAILDLLVHASQLLIVP